MKNTVMIVRHFINIHQQIHPVGSYPFDNCLFYYYSLDVYFDDNDSSMRNLFLSEPSHKLSSKIISNNLTEKQYLASFRLSEIGWKMCFDNKFGYCFFCFFCRFSWLIEYNDVCIDQYIQWKNNDLKLSSDGKERNKKKLQSIQHAKVHTYIINAKWNKLLYNENPNVNDNFVDTSNTFQ